MHVGWLALVEPPPEGGAIDGRALRRTIEARLEHAPRFRKRVVDVPVGEPPLIDDPAFSVDRHVRIIAAAEVPVDADELQRIADAFLSTQLDRARPLWELLIVPRLADGGAAILGKVHHALVDGIAAVELGTLLFDLDPDTSPAEPAEYRPAMPPSPVRLLISSATDTALEQFRAAGRIANLGLQPARGLRVADSMRRAAFQMAREVAEPAPGSYLNGPISPARTLRTTTLPLAHVLALKERSGSKLNDVVLTLVSGALHEFSLARGANPTPLRAMIPINVRGAEGGPGSGGQPDRLRLPRAAGDHHRPAGAIALDPPPGRGPARRRARGWQRRADAVDGGAARADQVDRHAPRLQPTDLQPDRVQRPRSPGRPLRSGRRGEDDLPGDSAGGLARARGRRAHLRQRPARRPPCRPGQPARDRAATTPLRARAQRPRGRDGQGAGPAWQSLEAERQTSGAASVRLCRGSRRARAARRAG